MEDVFYEEHPLFIDCTWDDPIGASKVYYNYFLLNEEEFSKTHTSDDTFAYHKCTGTKY